MKHDLFNEMIVSFLSSFYRTKCNIGRSKTPFCFNPENTVRCQHFSPNATCYILPSEELRLTDFSIAQKKNEIKFNQKKTEVSKTYNIRKCIAKLPKLESREYILFLTFYASPVCSYISKKKAMKKPGKKLCTIIITRSPNHNKLPSFKKQ